MQSMFYIYSLILTFLLQCPENFRTYISINAAKTEFSDFYSACPDNMLYVSCYCEIVRNVRQACLQTFAENLNRLLNLYQGLSELESSVL